MSTMQEEFEEVRRQWGHLCQAMAKANPWLLATMEWAVSRLARTLQNLKGRPSL